MELDITERLLEMLFTFYFMCVPLCVNLMSIHLSLIKVIIAEDS